MYCQNGLKESLYASIQNALAHGNIIKINEKFLFYSVTGSVEEKEYEKNITFLLFVDDCKKLKYFMEVLEKFR